MPLLDFHRSARTALKMASHSLFTWFSAGSFGNTLAAHAGAAAAITVQLTLSDWAAFR